MENQKIRILIKKIALSFLFFGITTMNYAQNFQIKHIYEPIVNTLGHHMSTASFPIAISGDGDVITSGLAGSSIIDSNEFGIYKTPLTTDAKKRVDEINQLLRMPYIEKNLIINNPKGDFAYRLDIDKPNMETKNFIEGFEIDDFMKDGKYHNLKDQKKYKNSQLISQFYFDLVDIGYSTNKVKVADFYGTTNIIPKKEGLEVIVTLKNVGPFDVKITNPKDWQDISNDQYYESYKKWYELKIGGIYNELGCWVRILLLSDYLIKDNLTENELEGGALKIKSNSEKIVKFLVPYKKIKVELTNGEIDTNRTIEGYIHFDHNAAIILSDWSMHIDFGGFFSKQVWKEEKSSQVKGWVNLQ